MSGLQFVGLFGGGGGEQKTCYIEAVTSSGLWTVPAGVTEIDLFLVPGGTGGGAATTQVPSNQRGRGGKPVLIKGIPVSPLSVHACTIGTGGTGGNIATPVGYGGNTAFDGYIAPGTDLISAAVSVFPDEISGLLVSGSGTRVDQYGGTVPRAGAGVGFSAGGMLSGLNPEPNTGSGGGTVSGSGIGSPGASGVIYIRYYK